MIKYCKLVLRVGVFVSVFGVLSFPVNAAEYNFEHEFAKLKIWLAKLDFPMHEGYTIGQPNRLDDDPTLIFRDSYLASQFASFLRIKGIKQGNGEKLVIESNPAGARVLDAYKKIKELFDSGSVTENSGRDVAAWLKGEGIPLKEIKFLRDEQLIFLELLNLNYAQDVLEFLKLKGCSNATIYPNGLTIPIAELRILEGFISNSKTTIDYYSKACVVKLDKTACIEIDDSAWAELVLTPESVPNPSANAPIAVPAISDADKLEKIKSFLGNKLPALFSNLSSIPSPLVPSEFYLKSNDPTCINKLSNILGDLGVKGASGANKIPKRNPDPVLDGEVYYFIVLTPSNITELYNILTRPDR